MLGRPVVAEPSEETELGVPVGLKRAVQLQVLVAQVS